MTNYSLYSVHGLVILDSEGNRVMAKYYDKNQQTNLKEQRTFEKGLFDKTSKGNGDIILYNDKLILYKSMMDLIVYLIAPSEENELMLSSALNGFIDGISLLLRHQLEKTSVIENLDMVLLALDESIDDGIILETDSNAIASRVSRPKADTNEIQINEQTIMRAFDMVKDRVSKIQL
ncbi:coatomer protein [Wallemia mellicola CBS 633.66]|uniref:Coatomer subunit zeta n=1 Tax=Wallemia mellicola (strain ATCC MYA-4683 / CBS 633.66) TaxID=671144 RepID=I4YAZ2_WALMC|nr:coatomer protein [Wallemia mellicola CBS 633.66]EIM21134.1 coatomer protein [Wallemia mellicola CBS 633.66]|eukprot:XP_006958809.1 coatomer protein [Wallemia mellicola CBS 633.66]